MPYDITTKTCVVYRYIAGLFLYLIFNFSQRVCIIFIDKLDYFILMNFLLNTVCNPFT